jgi:glucose-6-phosphate 1-dehydrogenase
LKIQESQTELVERFFKFNRYIQGSYDCAEDFQKLNVEISKLDKSSSGINRLFYLALPPSVYNTVATNINAHCMATG